MSHAAAKNMKQTSMTEWFSAMGDVQSEMDFKKEDNSKVERLTFLHNNIDLPFREPIIFQLNTVTQDEIDAFIAKDPMQRVAVRLVPDSDALPKIRQRGLNRTEALTSWIPSQDADKTKYSVHLFPDEQNILWWMNFAVSESGIFGEITNGWYLDMEKGEGVNPHFFFNFDFEKWEIDPKSDVALKVLQNTVGFLKLSEEKKQKISHLNPEFSKDYLVGYFEALVPPDGNIYFNDFNQTLGKFIQSRSVMGKSSEVKEISGVAIVPGKVSGTVKIVTDQNFKDIDFKSGDILVSRTTNVDFLSLMKIAGAIVTDLGGILSHPAIVARELKKPCIVATKKATQEFQSGDTIEVDADHGMVRKIS
jgi:phosphohistidine swiveling domain-containing protein